jgi:low affinity Fe/Cu permease
VARPGAWLTRFLKWSSRTAGQPISFVIALALVGLWMISGLLFGFSDTWLLILNTIATINATLMVFIIQNTQIRDTKALQLKLDELLYALKEAQNELIAIEELEEEELEIFKKRIKEKRDRSESH